MNCRWVPFLLRGSLLLAATVALTIDAEVSDSVSRVLQRNRVPGAAYAVVQQGPVVQVGGIGRRDIREPATPTGDTVFAVASLSKPVFAYGVMLLVQDGVIDLDRPLIQYWPEPWVGDERNALITARMVLTHTSGLARRATTEAYLIDDPGARFEYSNSGFIYLQRVVEFLTGQDLESFMQQRVFRPLGMTRSSYRWQEAFADNFAVGHERRRAQRHWQPSEPASAYSLQTTAYDLGRFLAAVMQPEVVRGPLSEGSIATMLATQVSTDGRHALRRSDIDWALGWGVQERGWGREVFHDGHSGGIETFIWGSPEHGIGLVVLTNQPGHSDELAAALMDALTDAGAAAEEPRSRGSR
jgi:CubicO group peptidase (beta-lactamase class C family)